MDIKGEVKKLFARRSELSYRRLLNKYQLDWDRYFVTYYNKNIDPDIENLGARTYSKFGF